MVRDDVARHDASPGDLPRFSSPQVPPAIATASTSVYASEKATSTSEAAPASASSEPFSAAYERPLLDPWDRSSTQERNKSPEPDRGMSNQHPAGSNPPGLPTTYPPTTNPYGAQGAGVMTSIPYGAYGSPPTQAGDLYRGSPVLGNSSQPLPSMRTFDPMPQQRAMLQSAPHGMAMTQEPHGVPYYTAPMMAMGQGYGMPPENMAARYNIPPHDPRFMGHRPGPKKEIKRRTKTGCLTCRKRRIKCDETQPTCNNCKKSKRDCLGYDPMFRQASSPGQPSPGSQTTQGSSSTVPGIPSSPSSSAQPGAHIPYGAQPSNLPGSYSPNPRQTPPSAGSNISHDSQISALASTTTLKSQSAYGYSPVTDHQFRSVPGNTFPEATYPPGQRHNVDDYYQYRGGPPSS